MKALLTAVLSRPRYWKLHQDSFTAVPTLGERWSTHRNRTTEDTCLSSVFSLPSIRTWMHLEKILETNLQPGSLPCPHALRNVSGRCVVRTQSARYLLPSTQTQTSFPKDGKLLLTPAGALSPAPSPEPAAQARLPQPGSGQRDSGVRPLRTVILVGNFLTPRTLRCSARLSLVLSARRLGPDGSFPFREGQG